METPKSELDKKIAAQESLIQELERRLARWKDMHGEASATYIAQKDWIKRERVQLIRYHACRLYSYAETHGEESAMHKAQEERLHQEEKTLIKFWITLLQDLERRVCSYREAYNNKTIYKNRTISYGEMKNQRDWLHQENSSLETLIRLLISKTFYHPDTDYTSMQESKEEVSETVGIQLSLFG